ncbi:SDR family NAD(P)-dependent oxidoreductase [Plastoroseomonas hellenica]|uniref:SDR family NAD(P)-dependent oxidoreductase n=1 Tax=Plastoroseomonas hellenica TaxID=2687306 RepID=UPI001BACFAA6|nr:SDR family NAD(P)-dependent oxidoreductase [Plastoroseomonas hellenica]MBR0642725.1 SDR family NAD(P)-dependent oxidoreductase [Plastoroseomonas hellenica]
MGLVTLVTGASSGFGNMIARDLAQAGHVVYASMRGTDNKNADKVKDNAAFATEKGVDLRSIELDVQDDASIAAAADTIIREVGRIDVLVQNAGHMVYGPSEAFTAEQLRELYDVNVLGTQRVNRAVVPHMRAARSGLLVWVSSSSVAGGVPPLLGPYFAAKAAMDALAVCYAKELAPFCIETSIVVPGAFTTGTNHFANAGAPEDKETERRYIEGYPDGFMDNMKEALASTVPKSADPGAVGRAVVDIVAAPHGDRPLRVHVDPASDGAAVTFAVMDRVRSEFLHRIGYPELLHPSTK